MSKCELCRQPVSSKEAESTGESAGPFPNNSGSQCQIIGTPAVKSWNDYENGCLATYGGGYRTEEELSIFHHGIVTVFNLLRAEFPPAEQCKTAKDLMAACQAFKAYHDADHEQGDQEELQALYDAALTAAEAAIAKISS